MSAVTACFTGEVSVRHMLGDLSLRGEGSGFRGSWDGLRRRKATLLWTCPASQRFGMLSSCMWFLLVPDATLTGAWLWLILADFFFPSHPFCPSFFLFLSPCPSLVYWLSLTLSLCPLTFIVVGSFSWPLCRVYTVLPAFTRGDRKEKEKLTKNKLHCVCISVSHSLLHPDNKMRIWEVVGSSAGCLMQQLAPFSLQLRAISLFIYM